MSKTTLLPFVTEKASDSAIFKAIIQRTRGSSVSAITNLFSVILKMGIEPAREKVDSFPTEMTMKDRISQLVAQYPAFHAPKSELAFWSFVMHQEQTLTNDKFYPQYSYEEKEILFSVIAVSSPVSLSKTDFKVSDSKFEKYKAYEKESFDIGLNEMEHVTITQKVATRRGFTSLEELKAFIAFNEIQKSPINVFPVKVESSFSESEYAKHHCYSPYVRSQ